MNFTRKLVIFLDRGIHFKQLYELQTPNGFCTALRYENAAWIVRMNTLSLTHTNFLFFFLFYTTQL